MKFRNVFGGAVLLGVLLLGGAADAAGLRDYPRVAVMDFGNKAVTSRGLQDEDMSSAAEYALYQLSESGWFDLIDYASLAAIAEMHSINMSGLVDHGTVVKLGKFAGAEYMVVGNVTGLTAKKTGMAFVSRYDVTANVTMRIVDIETGRILVMGLGKASSSVTGTGRLIHIGTTEITAEQARNAISKAVRDAIYGDAGILTKLNGGKKLKPKTEF